MDIDHLEGLSPTVDFFACPKCGTVRADDDVYITWEYSYEPGKSPSTKKIIKANIKTVYDDDKDNLLHTCGLCEHEWETDIPEPRVVAGDSAAAALEHLRMTRLDNVLADSTRVLDHGEWEKLLGE